MAYNRVSAMGVQHGLLNPADEMAMRQAQMQLLASAGGGQGQPSGDTMPTPQPQPMGGEILNNVGRPAYETDYANRQFKADQDMQAMKGDQSAALEKEATNRALGVANITMSGANREAALNERKYADELARRDELKKQLDVMTNPNQPPTADGATSGGFTPFEKLQLYRAAESDGQLPDIPGERAQTKLRELQTKEIGQNIKSNEQTFNDAQTERQAQILENQGNLQAANELRQKGGLANKYQALGDTLTEPTLVAALDQLKKATKGYGSVWRDFNDLLPGKSMNNTNSMAQQNELIKGQLDMLIGQFMQKAGALGYNPKEAKTFAIKALRPILGDSYSTGF